MAARFWVGGTGNWSDNTNHWASSSGGAPGASKPGVGDTATLDGSSGGGTVTADEAVACNSITMGAFTGTFDANGQTVSLNTFSCTGSGTRTLIMGTGTWTLAGTGTAWTTATTTNLTFDSTGSTLVFTGASQTINSNGLTFATVNFNHATPNATITGGNFIASACTITGSGTVTLTSGGTGWNVTTLTANTSTVIFTGAGAANLTSNGQSFYNVTFNKNAGVAITLQDAFICTNNLVLSLGTLACNGQNVTCGTFNSDFGANTRVLSNVTGNLTFTGTGNLFDINPTGSLTISTFTANVFVTNTSSTLKTLSTNGVGGTSLTVSGDNVAFTDNTTYTTLNLNNAGLPNGFIVTAGRTITVTNFTTNGSAGNLAKMLSSSAGTAFNLSKASGTVNASYMSLKDSAAAGGATWNAINSTNASGNSGWVFSTLSTFLPIIMVC